MKLRCPGKTFLIGEYAALQGEPALVITTKPFFELQVHALSAPSVFHPESPAGKLYQTHLNFFENYSVSFQDPYESKGGFGASSAEFLLLYRYLYPHDVDAETLRKDYLHFALKGSGYDVIAQHLGCIAYIHANQNKTASFDWPFHDITFLIAKTSVKVNTHEHLSSLNTSVDNLKPILHEGISAFQKADSDQFCEAINAYFSTLSTLDLVIDNTHQLITALKKDPRVLAAKGCGALGADAILLLCKKNDADALSSCLRSMPFSQIIGEHDLCCAE